MGRGRGGGGRFNRDEGPPSEIVGAYGFGMILYIIMLRRFGELLLTRIYIVFYSYKRGWISNA
jgi:hypothetical protein